MSIGARIKEFIDSKNLSIREFAESIEMTYENLYAYVSDKREPGAIVLKRLYDAGADLNYILMGERKNVHLEFQKKVMGIEKILKKYDIKNLNDLEESLAQLSKIKKLLCDSEIK